MLTAGLGGMGGAQPLAVKMAGGVCIAVEVDPARAERRVGTGYCDVIVHDATEAMRLARDAAAKGETLGIALIGNAADMFHAFRRMGLAPAVVTDQTSAHDPLNGYVPRGHSLRGVRWSFAPAIQTATSASANASIVRHVGAMLGFQDDGAIVFEYGNNIRGQARGGGRGARLRDRRLRPHVHPAELRHRPRAVPLGLPLGRSRGPCRDRRGGALAEFPDDDLLKTWMAMAKERVPIQGLPARSCWLGLGERDRMGLVFNRLVREGRLKGPIAMSRDHLDTGLGGAADARDRKDEGRQRPDRRLAAPQRASSMPSTAPTWSRSTRAAAAAWAARSRPG